MTWPQGIDLRNELRDVTTPGSADPDMICAACVERLPHVTDASLVATGTTAMARETVAWRGPDAVGLEDLQYVLGEGPGLDASSTGRPVPVPDLSSGPAMTRWPAFAPAAGAVGIRSAVAVPVLAGAARVGVLALYGRYPDALPADTLEGSVLLAGAAAEVLLSLADADLWAAGDRSGRTVLHQAVGVVAARYEITIPAAMTLVREYARRRRQPLRQVATDIVEKRIDVSVR
jgi:hypothetical protein